MMNRLLVVTLAAVVAIEILGCTAPVNAAKGPVITSISPSSVTAGGAGFTLTVNGSNFNGNSNVLWNGAQRPTVTINSTQLQAFISNTDIATAGTVQITVVDPKPFSHQSNPTSLTINSVSLAITTASLPTATIQQPYSADIRNSGGVAPYTWKLVSGQLPPGLALGSTSGAISGIPGQTGSYGFTTEVIDSSPIPQTASQTLAVSVTAPSLLSINTTTLTNGTVQVAYSATLAASGGVAPYSWSVVSGSLPPGLALSNSTGAIAGIPTAGGQYSFTVQVKDSAASTASQAFTVSIAASPLQITTTSLPGGTVGVTYSATLAASGGATPYSWSIQSGQLPTGLTLQSSTGTISGTPSVRGAFTFIAQVADSAGQSASSTFSINIAVPINTTSSQSTLSYSVAKTDTGTYSSPAPSLGGAGTFTTDPDFGMRVLRVTQSGDCSLLAAAGFTTAGSGAVPMWNKDSTKLMFNHPDSGNWLYKVIDTVNFTTTGPCVNVVPAKLAGFASFSWGNANRIYGLDPDGSHLSYLDTSSGTVTQMTNLSSIPGFSPASIYLVEPDRNDGWVCSSSNSQDLGTRIGCYNMQTGATQVLNLANATAQQGSGSPVALDNLSASQLSGCGIHTIGIDASGQWVHFGANGCATPLPGNSTTQNELFWQLGTNHIVWQPTRITGHTGLGYNSAFVEGAGQGTDSCPANDYRGWDLWFASDMGTAGSPKWVQANACTPAPNGYGINTDEHVSWLNNVNDSNANRYPLILNPMDNDSVNCGGLNYLCWEIDALQMGPAVDKWNAGQYGATVSSATIWRFAHTYNDPTNSQCGHIGYSSPNVSHDGKYVAFPSDWMGQTGAGTCTNGRRTDVFVVELK